MEPLLMILIPGVIGGVLLALLIASAPPRIKSVAVRRQLSAPTPFLINMAHIRVEGLGGLGMVAAVVAVAIAEPRIRIATLLAAVLGCVLAFALVVARRRKGAFPSAGDGPDERSVLHLESPALQAGEAQTPADRQPPTASREPLVNPV
jgi:hypothetical protein